MHRDQGHLTGVPARAGLLARARDHHLAGRLEQAAEIYGEIVRVSPDCAEAWHRLGLLARQAGRVDVAAQAMSRAIAARPDDADLYNDQGIALGEAGDPANAAAHYRRALEIDPGHAEAHNNLGVVLRAQGDLVAAVACYRRALELHETFAQAHNNLGVALAEQGAAAEAMRCWRRALALDGGYAEAHYNLGNGLRAESRFEEAAASYREAVRLRPRYAEAHNNLGVTMKELGRFEESADCCRRALESRQEFAEAHYNLGNALKALDRGEEAMPCFRRAWEIKPDYFEACNNLGVLLAEQGGFQESVRCCEHAVQLRPGHALAHYNLGNALRGCDRFEEAAECYRRALALEPGDSKIHNNLGIAMQDLRRPEEAIAGYRRALELAPLEAGMHMNLAFMLLLCGRFEEGWSENEWRLRKQDYAPRRFTQPVWAGEPPAGKTILVQFEQGLGDVIQFVRYVDWLRGQGARVLLYCPQALVRLLARGPAVDGLFWDTEHLPPFDFHVPMLSLPAIHGTTLENLPARIPYLAAEPALAERWRARLEPHRELRVGIAWQGNPKHNRDRFRSIPLSSFQVLAQIAGVRLFSVQRGAGSEQLRALHDRLAIVDLGPEIADLADTAAALVNLDVLISCDTAVAHLAGALGVPAWIALQFSPDWRWLLERQDSPWYPGLRLYRQEIAGSWREPFEHMARALAAWSATARELRAAELGARS